MRSRRPGPGGYQPRYNWTTDQQALRRDAAVFFGRPLEEVEQLFRACRELHDERGYSALLGEQKTLDFEEAFLLFCIMSLTQPRTIVEIGTQYGKSTRRIIDMKNRLGLPSEIVCFDLEDRVRFFRPEEARLVLKDVTGSFQEDVVEALSPQMIFLDARPYYLLQNVIAGTIASTAPCVLAIHDCTTGLYNARMKVSRTESRIGSITGNWERYVLAEVFGVADPGSDRLDRAELPGSLLRIFGTPHGLGVILPRRLREEWEARPSR